MIHLTESSLETGLELCLGIPSTPGTMPCTQLALNKYTAHPLKHIYQVALCAYCWVRHRIPGEL